MLNLDTSKVAKNLLAIRIGLLVLFALVAICKMVDKTDCLRDGNKKPIHSFLQPFDMSRLPGHRSQNFLKCSLGNMTACLGHVLKLNTEKRPKMRETKPTRFYIYTAGQWTNDIEFRARSPDEKWGLKKGELNWELDYQFNLTKLAGSKFDVKKQTVILIAGYLNTYLVAWQREAAKYLTKIYYGQVNIIVAVWPEVYTMYGQAVAETVMISRQITMFLYYLAQLGGIDLYDQTFLDRIHLVGHSLGAHISGFVGKDLDGRVGRITGLDPAGPDWDNYARKQRLDRDDAQLVEILHTNGGKMRPMRAGALALVNSFALLFSGKRALAGGTRFGMQPQLGHVDYFANDGQHQSGCTDPVHFCDHARAYQIYVNLLEYQLFLRDNLTRTNDSYQRQHQQQQPPLTGGAVGYPQASRRLWAMRIVDTFDSFRSGSHLANLCPQSIEPQTHLDPLQVGATFNKCTVPLMDMTKPLHELIRELRDFYEINFERNIKPIEQQRPNFHFSTQDNPQNLLDIIGRQFMLKVYLDSEKTKWNLHQPSRCRLEARLQMASGELIELRVKIVENNQSILSMPFAHPAGQRADTELNVLLGALNKQRSKKSGALMGRPSVASKTLLKSLFPRRVELQLVDRGRGNNKRAHDHECQLAIKEIEVQPISLPGVENVAVISGSGLFSKRGEYEFVGTRKLTERLAVTNSIKTLSRSKGTKLLKETYLTLVDDNYLR